MKIFGFAWQELLFVISFGVIGAIAGYNAHAGIPTWPEYHWRLVAEVEFVKIDTDKYLREIVAKAPINSIEYRSPNDCASVGAIYPWPDPMPAPKQGGELVQIMTCLPYKSGEDSARIVP